MERIVSKLDLRPGRTVLDLAAGTGKLTRLLVPSGANVIAIEPVREMRQELEQRVPGIVALAGTAERMPLTDGYVDAVTVGQAFHWFRQDEALREIQRVLRPGGGLALIWNARDERHPVQAALSELIDPLEGDAPRRKQRDWRSLLGDSGLFERCERALFEHEQVVDEQGLVERVVSISFIAAGPAAGARRGGGARPRDRPQIGAADQAAVHDRAVSRLRDQLTDGSSGMRATSS